MSETDRNIQTVPEEGKSPSEAKPSKPEAKAAKPRGIAHKLGRFLMVVVYMAFLTVVVLGTLAAIEYYAYLKVKATPLGQAYKNRSLDTARMSSQTVAPQYGYEPTPGFVAIRNTKLGNSYEYINDQNFKDFEDVPLEKPENEYRVIVTGGSVVYGRGPVPPADAVADYYEVTYRWTIPHIMEQLLNADPDIRSKINGKKVRVINAGVPGYVYQSNLMRYLAKLRLYKPDLLVALDGANEVHTVARPLKDWNYFTEGPVLRFHHGSHGNEPQRSHELSEPLAQEKHILLYVDRHGTRGRDRRTHGKPRIFRATAGPDARNARNARS